MHPHCCLPIFGVFFLFQHVICCIFPWYNELYKVNSNLSAAAQVRSFSVSM